MREFLSINLFITPPTVSKPNDNGITSTRRTSFITSLVSPDKIAAYLVEILENFAQSINL